ncbi:TonB-dependent receptor [Burkholderia cenocepacia]|uniref:TonB-dependent receptor n=1 Tax=Burkholderia cenocepacia TaxID=95486 RepID=A0ABD4U7P7_9BURK|nr:TonB-dependent receptor [Burkholderia cenocepacia]MCW3694910.1 TonB-dependent receptor [Burkholderia cenocepacia]MCW3701709.1 TonB-dependent receptor [Burkholderia cenocepacia]MCW3710443.1 TonB-dependent receptor [Burkholderia cenocepacia]MCW3718760.1 TonB-dependent receptor [Burkholderia cenocepacia]MCW3725770.1 TonB-dependent receptor [Burkholderia cenocepacia]
MKFKSMLPAAVLAALSPAGQAHAQERGVDGAGATLAPIRVDAQKAPALTQPLDTGSHLGLSPLETPASVEQINRATLDTRGDNSIIDAVSRAAGISASPHPGNGNSELAARGFVGASSVTQLYDGMRPYGAIGVTFPFDTWSVDHIDVLRGPASVIYGEGAIGGVVNIVPKKPTRTPIRNELQVGGGTEGTARAAFGSGGAINDKLSYRFDVSGNRSSNWVDRGDSRNLSVSGALRYDVTPDLYVTASYAQGFMHPMQYFGAPLVDGARDRALDKKNYNVGDADIAFRDSWATVSANWQPSDALNVTSTLYRMKSNRHWKDAEYYTYLPSSAQVRRSSYTEIFHDQEQYGNVTTATVGGALLGMRNTFSAGVEFNHTTFQHDNNSPYAGTSTVDPFNFDPGSFINTAGTFPKYRSQSNQYALFAENRLEITPRWSVIGGLRYDHASVNRDDLVNGGAFTKVFANTGWRIGTVYDVRPGLAVYGQYSVAADPVSSLLSLNASKANFTLATGRQIEIGVKQSFLDGKAEWTLAAYRIVKSNLLTADPVNPNQSIQVGQQSSRGLEATVGAEIAKDWRVDANVSILRAKYDDFQQSSGGTTVSRAGNVPVSVPQRLANLWVSWRFAPDWTGIAGVKYVGKRFADTANQLVMPSYTTVDLGLAWKPRKDTTITARAYNVFNRRYVQSAYYNETQYLLGNDRRVELLANYRF